MDLFFWQNILTPHQSAYIRALPSRLFGRVTIVCEERLTPDRAALGWKAPDYGSAVVTVAPDDQAIDRLIAAGGTDAVHVVGGLRGCLLTRTALRRLTKTGRRVGIVSEAADARGWVGLGRRAVYTAERYRVGKAIDFVLAIGTDGVNWYRSCGFPPGRIFPFLYVTEAPSNSLQPIPSVDTTFELTFVGRCVSGKGLEALFRALRGIAQNCKLSVVGDGPMRARYHALAMSLGLEDRVTFTGAQPYERAMSLLQRMDLLVLPSDGKEGWGAVVNEALMRGVPVLCSDHCGARDLLADTSRGEVFKAGSVDNLRDALVRWIDRGKRTPDVTRRIRTWSRCIEGESVAGYFISVLEHVCSGGPRPTAPWLARAIPVKRDGS
jgi:glycosyltransferase involved in cell wall biosynthesis